ncbi:TonB-dependent receptor [Proteus terrae]|mgnify:CR=1 FL=1|uniref:TonB-dependent receptor domain-containing protein n=1 Tax=Proteus terrae TaxID=1574161 RepID=UPI002095EE9A|nr:TonB-dependent receptor [Proteus terrae]MCO7050321.1 TonB-dependent receptor [Proteus terrae]
MDIYGMCMLKKHFKYSGIATALCLLYSPIASAQSDNTEMDSLTVVGHSIDKTTHDFHSILDSSTPQAQTASTTGEMLNKVAGATLSGTGVTNGANILMRGYDQKGVKILVDGIEQPLENTINNLGGIFLDPSLVKRIDIKHGSSPVLHGNGAMGGVVSFQTLDPRNLLKIDEKLSTKLFTSLSSADRHFTYGGIIAGRHDIAEGLFAYSQRQRGPIHLANGKKLENHEHINNFFAKAYLYPTENQTLIFSARHYENKGTQREVLHRMGGFGKNESNQVERKSEQKNYSVTYHYEPETQSWVNLTNHLYYSQFNINQIFLTDTSLSDYQRRKDQQGKIGRNEDRTQLTYGLKIENSSQFSYSDILNQKIILGSEAYQQKMVSNQAAKNFPLAKMVYVAGWMESQLSTPHLPLALTTGLRYHYYKNKPQSELNSLLEDFNQHKPDFHQTSEGDISKNIALTFTPTQWLQLYTSYSTNMRVPTLNEMFNDSLHFEIPAVFGRTTKGFWIPNPNLSPEKNRTWEYGGKLTFSHLLASDDEFSLNATYFDTKAIDYITYDIWNARVLTKKLHLQAINIPQALIDGIDLGLRYSHPLISIGLGYNRTRTLELTTHETISPVRPEILTTFIQLPIAKTSFSLGWSGKFASATENKGTHKGRAPHVKGKTTNRMQELIAQYPGYGIHDFSISYQSQNNKNIQAALVLANAFNREYFSALGVPQEGRNIKMSVSYRW